MRPSRLAAFTLTAALVGLPACQPAAPVQTAGAPAATPTPAKLPLGVVFGQLRLPAAVVASQGGSIISTNGAGIVAQGGGNLVGNSGGTLVAAGTGQIISTNGAGIVAQGGGNIVAQGGGNLVGNSGGTIVASSGANIVAQGGGNIVAQGGGNIVAQGGGNLVGNSGGTYRLAQATDVIDALAITPSRQVDPQVAPGESHAVAHAVVYLTDADGRPLPGAPYAVTDDQGYYFFAGLPTSKPVIATSPFLPTGIRGNIVAQGGGNFGLLDAGPVLEQEVVKASPKVLALPTTLDHLPTAAGAGVAAIAARNGLTLPTGGSYRTLGEHANNGDISLATTITSNLLLAGQQGQVVELDQAQFDVVVDRVADALLTAPLSTVFQPLPQVPLLVDLQKLDLPEGTDLTFRQRDQELAANEQARKQAEAELAKLDGDAKQAKAAELARLEAEAKRVAQEKVDALFELAARLKQKLAIEVKTDNQPVDANGDGALDEPSRGLPQGGSTDENGPTTPGAGPNPNPAQEPDGLPTEDQPTPTPSVDAQGNVTVTPGGVNNAGTEAIP